MRNRRFVGLAAILCPAVAASMLSTSGRPASAAAADAEMVDSLDPSGQLRTLSPGGPLDLDNPFFQDLGTNGRRCVTCHQPDAGWTITPANVQERFRESRGADPIFTNNDGSTCEGAVARSLADKRAAYGLLLTRGLFRIGLDVPPGAEFVIESVSDPNRCGPATNDASLYRRPLPSTNLGFLTAVMWDGRESTPSTTILQDLAHQANDATLGHAQATHDLTDEQVRQIVAFETGLFTAQVRDDRAGNLRSDGARGGPRALSTQGFFIGINDPVGLNPSGAAFDPNVFTLFDAWAGLGGSGHDRETNAQKAIARGQALFNTRTITISGVAGLNGVTFPSGQKVPESFAGSCTICHDSPNVGNHSVKAPLDIGLTAPAQAPYLPVYTLRNLSTQETLRTTDPGRAMITGKWADVNKFKGPILRALAARAPYFHNGSATTLDEVVQFYDTRFNIGFTAREKADLVAFLRAL
jgi:cytochrome c peroxidase